MDPTEREQIMKRAAVIIGIAAALAVPTAASAGNSLQVKPQVKAQVAAQVVAQVKPQLKLQVVAQVKPQVVAQVVETQRVKTKRFTLRRILRR
jgi:hypothetical protein